MIENNIFNDYINTIAQRIDWLVNTCTGQFTKPVAREQAREHLNSTVKEILGEVYEVGFIAGKKGADFNYDQKYRVNKFKLEKKLRTELKKEIVEIVLKEYGVKDDKIKKKIIKKVEEDEPEENGQDL